jgi:hypothetical protein
MLICLGWELSWLVAIGTAATAAVLAATLSFRHLAQVTTCSILSFEC